MKVMVILEAEGKEDRVRFTLPALALNKNLLLSGTELWSKKGLKLEEEMACNLGEDLSQIPSAIHSTMRHLRTRHMQVSQWQAQISESVGRVDREITAVVQVKDTIEGCLQQQQLYSQLMRDCVAISSSLSSTSLRQGHVLAELKREEKMTSEFRELLQEQICMLLNKQSSLTEIRTQLLADYQDKAEAIKLTTKCITHDLSVSSSRLPDSQYKPDHVSYDKWLSRCNNLMQTADNQIKDSSSFRGNLRLTLSNLKNAQERQCWNTDVALRKKINELSRVQNTLVWERQRIRDEISDLTADIQKVLSQIRNCDSKLHQATHRLDILNQRPRHELCLDGPTVSLTLEKHDLTKMAADLRPVLARTQQDLELTRRRLMIVENKLAKNVHVMEVEQKCRDLHRSSQPAFNSIMALAYKPRLCMAPQLPSYSRPW